MELTIEDKIVELLEDAYETRTNNLDVSIKLATEALELSKSVSDKALVGKSLNQLALFKMIRADYNDSIAMSKEAITYFEELDDDKGVADAKYNIAGVLYKTDQLHAGLVHLVSSLKTYRKYNDFHQQARVLKSIGTIYEYFGDDQKGLDTYLASVEAARKVENLNLESNALNPISGIYLNRGQIDRAMKVIQQSIKLKEKTNDIRGLAFALYGRGKVYTSMMEFEKAEKDFNEAIKIHQEMGEKLGIGMASHKMGYMYLIAGRKEEAKRYLKLASDFGMKNKIILLNFKCNKLLYQIYKEEGDTKKALRYLENYVTEKESVFNKLTLKIIEDYGLETDLNKI